MSRIFADWAPYYAEMGMHVFPLAENRKYPITKHGVLDATRDQDQIAKWARLHPNANIGAATGAHIGERGMMFIDIDKQHGGIETMKALVAKHGELPKGPLSITPHGGFHIPFAHVDGLLQGTNKLGQGVDVKINNGYLILPPSHWDGTRKGKVVLEGGGTYRWHRQMCGTNLPALPHWIAKMLTPKKKPTISVPGVPLSLPGREQIDALLSHIPPDDYDVWLRVGMAIKADLGEAGFPVWDLWSSGSDKYDAEHIKVAWRSFKRRNGITFASVVYLAKQNGADVGRILQGEAIG